MRIKEFISQSRRDLTLLFECEHCGNSFKGGGYDDENFHNNVVPDMECELLINKFMSFLFQRI